MLIDQAELRTLIPHTGAMCLLDGVLIWDQESVVCVSRSHRSAANPLRRNGRLAALHAFEYAAQAVAVHGGLAARAAGTLAPPGYLAALRDGRLYVAELPTEAAELRIGARQLLRNAASFVYHAEVSAAQQLLARVRVTIMLMPSQNSNS